MSWSVRMLLTDRHKPNLCRTRWKTQNIPTLWLRFIVSWLQSMPSKFVQGKFSLHANMHLRPVWCLCIQSLSIIHFFVIYYLRVSGVILLHEYWLVRMIQASLSIQITHYHWGTDIHRVIEEYGFNGFPRTASYGLDRKQITTKQRQTQFVISFSFVKNCFKNNRWTFQLYILSGF